MKQFHKPQDEKRYQDWLSAPLELAWEFLRLFLPRACRHRFPGEDGST